jgi:hypothetical protein
LIRDDYTKSFIRKEINLSLPTFPELRKAVEENKQGSSLRPGLNGVEGEAVCLHVLVC